MGDLKVGQVRKMTGGYDGDYDVMITAIGLQNVLYTTIPMVFFNGQLSEYSMNTCKFKQQSYVYNSQSENII